MKTLVNGVASHSLVLGIALVLAWTSCSFAETSPPRLTLDQWFSPRNGKLSLQIVSSDQKANSPLPHSKVRIFGGERIAFEGVADAKGFVTVEGIDAGVYALVATTETSFGYQALHVVQPSSEQFFPSVGTISCGSVSKADFERAVARYLPIETSLQSLELDFEHISRLSQLARPATSVVRCVDGTMNGHLFAPSLQEDAKPDESLRPAGFANVFLYQNGQRVDHKVTGAEGGFQFRHLAPGNYTLLTVGPDGLGAVGVELVADSPRLASTTTGRFVSEVVFANEFAMQVVPCCPAIATPIPCCEPLVSCCDPVVQTVAEPIPAEIPVADPVVASAPGGSGPVGGGGGIGGGFWAPPPVLPAAVGILAAASRDRDPPWQPPSAASPDTQP